MNVLAPLFFRAKTHLRARSVKRAITKSNRAFAASLK
jgi:hypothetical protein